MPIVKPLFNYFAYGSNLLKERLLLLNRSALFYSIAKLEGYKLDFGAIYEESPWKGGGATIVKAPGHYVWGVIWKLDENDLSNLDGQEGVERDIYKRVELEVIPSTDDARPVICRSYVLSDRWPTSGKPSPQYLRVIIHGALQNGIPAEYIDELKKIEHNGYSGELPIMHQINVPELFN